MQVSLFDYIKEFLSGLIKSRLFVLAVTIILLFFVLIQRLFYLQIVKGEDYLNDFTLNIKKEVPLASTRGNIYDRDGKLLAYNELAYAVTIEDNGTYKSTEEKNKELNKIIYNTIQLIEKNGDSVINDFKIYLDNDTFKFSVEGKQLERFLADMYGHSSTDDLDYNEKLGYNEATATAENVFDYLCGNKKFEISDEYSKEDALKIITVRNTMFENRFQKYLATTIATQVSDETVAMIKENMSELQGVDIKESTIRKYNDSEYFSHILGYTGKISEDELETLNAEDETSDEDSKKYTYEANDIVGKSGIEKVMEPELQGERGYETVYVDNVGKVIDTAERVEPTSGNDVYLTVKKDLQVAVYNIIEQKLAGVLYSKIVPQKADNINKGVSATDLKISIDDVYYALINNNIININRLSKEDASLNEKNVYQTFLQRLELSLNKINAELTSPTPTAYQELEKEMQVYSGYIVSMLTSNQVLLNKEIDTEDDTYLNWRNETISLKEYLQYAITKKWIDISKLEVEKEYSESSEIYTALLSYIQETLTTDSDFHKRIYKYLIRDEAVKGREICMILYEQEVLTDEEGRNQLESNTIDAYSFIKEKIKTLDITPAQLALDPSSGSCVITDVQSGEILASVSYPGYDNNRLANTIDSEYYSQLTADLSLPLYNHATQERTAPGSTFKMVTAVAGLTEGVIDTSTTVNCEGAYKKIDPNPKCWNTSGHGKLNVREAIRKSCNVFFYEVGYQLSTIREIYNEDKGIETLKKYAEMFGFGDNSGIEITETEPMISNELPVASAIGQGTHNYTTTQLARYVTTVANSGTCYKLSLLDSVKDSENNLIEDYTPGTLNKIDNVSSSTWDAVHQGMRLVVEEEVDAFKNMSDSIIVAGKTGTAQIANRANHALFVGYAYENKPDAEPEIAIATRIAYGYTSANAAEVASNVIKYYYKLADKDELINGEAQTGSNQVIGD